MVGRAIAQLLPPGFAITAGSLSFESENLLQMQPSRRRALLGRAIAFIPQAPMSALNPVMTIGRQFDEHLAADRASRSPRASRARAHHAGCGAAARCRRVAPAISAPIVRWHVPARAYRHGVRKQSASRHRRRADDCARRHHAPADHPPDRRHAETARHRGHLHHPRPAPCGTTLRRCDRDVCGSGGRKRPGAIRPFGPRPSLYAMPPAREPVHERRTAGALRHPGPDAELAPVADDVRLPFCAALSPRHGGLPPDRAAEHCDRSRP